MSFPIGLDSVPRRGRSRALAGHLRAQLESGQWPVGSRLPPDHELARTYRLGINTVRRAIEDLAQIGLVERRQGSGTFVNAVPAPELNRRSVGVVVPTTQRHFPEMIEGIEEVLGDAGVTLLLACASPRLNREPERIEELIHAGVSGLVVTPSLHWSPDPSRTLSQLTGLGVPVVLAERRPVPEFVSQLSFVCTDAVGGAYAAVAHLAQAGRERIGLLSSRRTGTSADVHAGFINGLRDLDLPMISRAVMRQADWKSNDFLAYAQILRTENIDGVLCLSDVFASRLLPHLRRVGLRVPDDIAIVAYEDQVADCADIPLTAVRPRRDEVGRLAAQTLLRAMDVGKSAAVIHVNVQPTLVLRASTSSSHDRSARDE